jgi:hypothetical protein
LQPFTTHATLLKGGAALQNLRIPIFLLKTIDFLTFKTQFLLPSELEVDLSAFLPPFLKRKFFERVALAYKRGRGRNTKTIKHRLFLGFSSIESKSLIK